MKVFINRVNHQYAGGMVIVAANDVNEAHEVLQKNIKDETWIDYFEELYDKDRWQLVEGVKADTDLPYVIAEDSYCE